MNTIENHEFLPFESPLEKKFAAQIVEYLKPNIIFKNQVEVETICGNFRLDFLAETSSGKIAFECDGKNFHDPHARIYDFWRDAAILAENHVDGIYRILLSNRKRHITDSLFIISQLDQTLFHPTGITTLQKSASKYAKAALRQAEQSVSGKSNFKNVLPIIIDYSAAGNQNEKHSETENPARQTPNTNSSQNRNWIQIQSEWEMTPERRKIYEFIQQRPGRRLNPLIYEFHKKFGNYGMGALKQ